MSISNKIHIDIWGLAQVESYGGKNYFSTYTNGSD
jgi:hypothetical protein